MEIRWQKTFDAAHRIWQHGEKCRFLHGHTYLVKVRAEGSQDKWGMVVDFGDLKRAVIDFLDHKTILHEKDPLVKVLAEAGQRVIALDRNPTAENLALLIGSRLMKEFSLNWVEVEVFETSTQSGFCRIEKHNIPEVRWDEKK